MNYAPLLTEGKSYEEAGRCSWVLLARGDFLSEPWLYSKESNVVTEQIVISLMSGIVSGVIAAGICLLIQRYWSSQIIPWIEERIYDEFSLAGRWLVHWQVDNSTTQVASGIDELELKQSGHRVWGTSHCIEGYDRAAVYEFSGTFKNNILTATYNDQDKTFLARGTVTLVITRHGQAMKGIAAFFNEETDEIEVQKCVLERFHRESPSTQSKADEMLGSKNKLPDVEHSIPTQPTFNVAQESKTNRRGVAADKIAD